MKKRHLFSWEIADIVLSIIFGAILALSAVGHLANPYFFLGSIYEYRFFGPGFGQFGAMVVPPLQMFVAIALVSRFFVNASHLIVLGLFGVFALIQSLAYFGDLGISCGCFGPEYDSPIDLASLSLIYSLFLLALFRNIALFAQLPDDASVLCHEETCWNATERTSNGAV